MLRLLQGATTAADAIVCNGQPKGTNTASLTAGTTLALETTVDCALHVFYDTDAVPEKEKRLAKIWEEKDCLCHKKADGSVRKPPSPACPGTHAASHTPARAGMGSVLDRRRTLAVSCSSITTATPRGTRTPAAATRPPSRATCRPARSSPTRSARLTCRAGCPPPTPPSSTGNG
eukprot:scaffold38031_cov68-Phaeocystis_antarctica.AAC.1